MPHSARKTVFSSWIQCLWLRYKQTFRSLDPSFCSRKSANTHLSSNPMAPVGLTWRKAHTVDPDSCQLEKSKRRLFRHHRGLWSGIDGEEKLARVESSSVDCLMLGTVLLRSHPPTGNAGRNQFVPTRLQSSFPDKYPGLPVRNVLVPSRRRT
ncbi:hypothetical protein BJX62DRAFT_166718 [Aspergillus germanicus]